MLNLRTVLVLFVLVFSVDGHSQQLQLGPVEMLSSDDYHIINWGTENGLPQSSVNDIIQSHDGYIWIASYGGLVRFDGVNFKTYHIGNTRGLESNRLKTLMQSRDDKLWIGHENGGVTIFENEVFYTPPILDSIRSEFVQDFCEDKDRNIWIGTTQGLYKFANDKLTRYGTAHGLPGNFVRRIYHNPEGGVHFLGVLAKDNKLIIGALDAEGNYHTVRTFDNSEPVYILDYNSDNELWFSEQNRLLNTKDGTVKAAYQPENMDMGLIQSFYRDSKGSLWIGTRKGLMILDPSDFDLPEGSKSVMLFEEIFLQTSIRRIMQDKEGNIWVGTDGQGLSMLKKRSIKRHYPVQNRAGYQNFDEMVADGKGGMWFAPICNGLYHYKLGQFSKIQVDDGNIWCVTGLTNDPLDQQVIYVGHDQKIGSIDRSLNYKKVVDLRTLFPQEESVFLDVNAILKSSKGQFWIGTTGYGLLIYENGLVAHYILDDGLENNWVHTIREMNNGEIWVGTDSGISIFSRDQINQISTVDGLANGAVRSILEDKDGIKWIGTYGGGLSKIEDREVTKYTVEDGLFEGIVSRIQEDQNGNLWMLGNKGLFMSPKENILNFKHDSSESLTCIPFGFEEGMVEGNGAGQVIRTEEGLTWWSTIAGIAAIDIDKNYIDFSAPNVVFQEASTQEHGEFDLREEIILCPNERDIEVTYAALRYADPEKVQYRYMLEGYDEFWRMNGNRRTINYTNLDPGEYVLKIQASYLIGLWGDEAAALDIQILPKYYEMTWVRLIAVVLAVLMLWGGFIWRNRYLIQKRTELASIVKSRTRELNEKNKTLESQKQKLESALSDLKDTQKRLVQSEKMASLGILAAGVAHEINNPLQFIRNGLDIIQKSERDLETLKTQLPISTDIIENGIDRASAIVSSLNQFSRTSERFDEEFDVIEVLENCLFILNSQLKHRIDVIRQFPNQKMNYVGNKGKLHQAFLNLLTNAMQAIPDKGKITIDAKKVKKEIVINISDTGIGIKDMDQAKIFDPFFTTKNSGEGSGLGLSITYDIILQHQGTIRVKSKSGKGSTFTIVLPEMVFVQKTN